MITKFAIGCLIQWYEVNIIEEYFSTLKTAIQQYDGEVLVDILLCTNQDLEMAEDGKLDSCVLTIKELLQKYKFNYNITSELVTIAQYRRQFNDTYCVLADVLLWGESDMLIPKQTFLAIDNLHQNVNTPKYIATFAICKMWDNTWKELEHPIFTVKNHSDSKKDWWGVNYDMSADEMNSYNDGVENLEVNVIHPHKFNGCGLVISSEVIKSGVNIPHSAFFIHEDTAFMLMTQKLLGNIPQYHFKNILIVHNRKHKNKRSYIKDEIGNTIGERRNSNKWYTVANKLCEQNVYNMFNPAYKARTWKDVWNSI